MTITKEQEMQLLGLMTLAASYSRKMDEILAAALEITGEGDGYGHTSDVVFGSDDPPHVRVERVLSRLGITVTSND